MRKCFLILLVCIAATAASRMLEQFPLGGLGATWETLSRLIVSNTTSTETEHASPEKESDRLALEALTRSEKEYASLQTRLSREAGTWNTNHPRYRLLTALYGFAKYKDLNLSEVKRWRDLYKHVPSTQKKVIEKVTGYTRKLNTVEHLFETNDKLAGGVLRFGLQFYGISEKEFREFVQGFEKEKKKTDRTSVVQAMKHFVRDWSAEGLDERVDAFACVLSELQGMQREDEQPLRVLLPGAGAGRLGYETDALGGFEVTINEWSAYMNLIYRYTSQFTTPNTLSYHPYIDWWSHHATTSDMQRAVTFPDWIPSSSNTVVMVEGDFTTVFPASESGTYDIIVTFFFIDTARNLMSYLETIHRLLKTGGIWINLGPLLYGTGPWVQFSVEEIVALNEELGFEFEMTETEQCGEFTPGLDGKVRSLYVPYAQNPRGLSRNAYDAQVWRAVKR